MENVVFFGCRAQLHTPVDGAFRQLVVICNAFGGEGLYAYRALGALAEDIAAAGMAALHLDYPGLGDSIDLEPNVDATQYWLGGLRAALNWARSHFPGVTLSLCGHRMGALLAAEVACNEPDVQALLLLSPPQSGRHLVRELQLTAQPAANEQGVYLYGWWLSKATLNGLQGMDLTCLHRRPELAVQVLSESGVRALNKLANQRTATGGGEFVVLEMGDLVSLRAEPHLVAVAEESFALGVKWLAQKQPEHGVVQKLPKFSPESGDLDLTYCVESGHRFGPAGAYFGILCRPHAAQAGQPCLLILNTGGNPRSGHHRLGVKLARELAQAGVASMRIDATGIGDTLPVVRGRSLSLYSQASLPDVGHAIAWLECRGWGRPFVFGVCSGAYLGLHAATEVMGIGGLIMVNPQSFLWEGEVFGAEVPVQTEPSAKVEIKHLGHYCKILFTRRFWQRLWHGEVAVAAVLQETSRALWFRFTASLQARLPQGWILIPRAAKVHALFAGLQRRRLPMMLVYADTDPGLNELQACFGPCGRRLPVDSGTKVKMVVGADHTFTDPVYSDELIDMVKEFVKEGR
jgi:alpha-beta hydrolase superfamily lysophospholipase